MIKELRDWVKKLSPSQRREDEEKKLKEQVSNTNLCILQHIWQEWPEGHYLIVRTGNELCCTDYRDRRMEEAFKHLIKQPSCVNRWYRDFRYTYYLFSKYHICDKHHEMIPAEMADAIIYSEILDNPFQYIITDWKFFDEKLVSIHT